MIDTINSIGSHFIMLKISSTCVRIVLVYAVLLLLHRVVCNLMSLLWFSMLPLLFVAYLLYIRCVKLNKWVNHLRLFKGANWWKVLEQCVRGACFLSTWANTLFSWMKKQVCDPMEGEIYVALSTKSKRRGTDPKRCRTHQQRYEALCLLRRKPNPTETEQKWRSEYENDPDLYKKKRKSIKDLKNKKKERLLYQYTPSSKKKHIPPRNELSF